MATEGLADVPEEWGDIFITRDLEGLNKMSFRIVTRLWDDPDNKQTQAWVVEIEATPEGELKINRKDKIDPVPWENH